MQQGDDTATLGRRQFTEIRPDVFALTAQVCADPALCREAVATAEERIVTLARAIQDEATDLQDFGVPVADLPDRMMALVTSVFRGQRSPTGVFEVRCEVPSRDEELPL